MDPYFPERVELLRGPTSVLYGKSYPRRSEHGQQASNHGTVVEIQFKMGTDNLWQTGFDFSDAIDDNGVWSYRLTGLDAVKNAQQRW